MEHRRFVSVLNSPTHRGRANWISQKVLPVAADEAEEQRIGGSRRWEWDTRREGAYKKNLAWIGRLCMKQ